MIVRRDQYQLFGVIRKRLKPAFLMRTLCQDADVCCVLRDRPRNFGTPRFFEVNLDLWMLSDECADLAGKALCYGGHTCSDRYAPAQPLRMLIHLETQLVEIQQDPASED